MRGSTAVGLALLVAVTAVWCGSAAVAPPVAADVSAPSTHRYDPEREPGDPVYFDGDFAVTLSEDGQSAGFLQTPVLPTFARTPVADQGSFLYMVADALGDGTGRQLWSLEPPPGTPAPHPGESQLSGDGLTFVATYEDVGWSQGYPCDDNDPTAPDHLYWHTQILRWQREDRESDFGDPELVSVSDPGECNDVDPAPGPDFTGVGGDDGSFQPTVSDDGGVVAFSSLARNLTGVPTGPVSGLYVAEEESGQLVPRLVTPANLDGDVTDPMISGDGDHIVFVSTATNLVSGVTPPTDGELVYMATRGSGTPSTWTFELISQSNAHDVAAVGTDAAEMGQPTIDAQGQRIAYTTDADNLDPTAWNPSEGPALVMRNTATDITRMAVNRREPDEEDVMSGAHLGFTTSKAHISRDGERVAVFGRRDFDAGSQLLLLEADAVLHPDVEERQASRLYSRQYEWTANIGAHVAIEGVDDSYVAVFPSETSPDPTFAGYGQAIFFVGGGVLGPDIARGWHGDPVDTANGAFRQDETDLAAPASAGTASITRSHTSVGEPGGVFGPGWSSTVDERLELDAVNGVVTLVNQSGLRTTFVEDLEGWRTADGSRLGLRENSLDWTVTDPGGWTRSFDLDGRLIGWSGPGLPAVEVQWDGATPAALVSASGYEVELFDDTEYEREWDPILQEVVVVAVPGEDGFVDRVVSSDGRQVDYGYELVDELTRLVTVSRPHAVGQTAGTFGVRTYTWSGRWIASIVDQVDATRTKVVVENTYDADGRVLHQVTDTGDELDFAYGQKPDPFGVLIPAPGFTTVTNDASGDVTVYQYNEAGELVSSTDAEGNSMSRSWAADRPEGATTRTGIVIDHAYDDAGRLTEVTQTVGATTRTIETITYHTPDTDPAAVTDDRVATRTDEAGVTTTYTYDGDAREPETESLPCDPASTAPSVTCPVSGLATTTYTYYPSGPEEGLVESVTDADGVVTEYTYAGDRSIETVTTFDGATPLVTTYETTRAGDVGWVAPLPGAVEVRTVETPGEAVTTEIYDAEGRIMEQRDPLYDGVTHLATTYTYGLDGELVSSTDPAGGTTTYGVARVGDVGWAEAAGIAEVRTVTGPDGISEISKTDRSGDVVVEQRGDPAVPAELATTTHVYGPLGRLESTTDPMGVTTTFEYDDDGQLTDVVDEDGERTVTTYDDFGRPTVVTDPLGKTTTTTYTDGQVTAVEDREENTTLSTYDAAGRPHTTTDARNGVVEQRYTLAGRLAWQENGEDEVTEYRYDTAGRPIEVELPTGAVATTTYDPDGRIASLTTPMGRVVSYTYDDLGRLETVADPAAGTTTTTYWPTGEVKTRTDATGGQVEYAYDGGGRVTSVTDALDEVTTYDHDTRGNRTLRVDALAGEREWHWNLADQLVEEVDPLDRSTTYTYDGLGRLDVVTDGAGRTTDHGYDEAGQVTSLTYASGTPTTFEYDGEGRRTKMVDGTGTTVWHYNDTGQMTGADLPGSRDLAFAWDLAGRRTIIDYPDGSRYRNVYDDGLLAEVEIFTGGTWQDVAVNTYDDDGLLIEQDQGTSGLREWDHDLVTGLLTGYDETRGLVTTSTALTHDAAGRVESETTGGVSAVYDYDDAGQLIEVDRSVGNDTAIDYDELGRRTGFTSGASTTTYQWDAASQLTRRVVAGANHNYQYDASGRRTREAWNGGNRVIQFFWGARGNLSGQRYTEPGTVTDIARATRGDGSLATLTTSVNSVVTDTTSVVWDPTMPVPQPVWTGDPGGTNATRAVYGPDLIRTTCPTGTSCTGPTNHDHLGSALRTTATSAVVQDNAYSPWGDGGGVFTENLNYGFRSELHSGDTIHLRARDYDPETGLFLSPDPLDGVDGTTTVGNPYHYADNDPVNRTDPTGLRPTDVHWGSARPSVMHFSFPVSPQHTFLGVLELAGWIPQRETSLYPFESPGARIFKGDGRGPTPSGSRITPEKNRFFVSLDFRSGRGYAQVNPTCRVGHDWSLPVSPGHGMMLYDRTGCTSAFSATYGVYSGNNITDPKYRKNYFQMHRAGDAYDFQWSVVQSDLGAAQDLLRPRADGHLILEFQDGVVEPSYEGDCFPSVEVVHIAADRPSSLGHADDVGAFGMIGLAARFHANVLRKC